MEITQQEEVGHITEVNGQLFFEFLKHIDTKNMHRITFDICKKILVKTVIVEQFQWAIRETWLTALNKIGQEVQVPTTDDARIISYRLFENPEKQAAVQSWMVDVKLSWKIPLVHYQIEYPWGWGHVVLK